MKEYAFDVNLKAVVRVKAKSERAARDAMSEVMDAMSEVMDAMEPTGDFLRGYNDTTTYLSTYCYAAALMRNCSRRT